MRKALRTRSFLSICLFLWISLPYTIAAQGGDIDDAGITAYVHQYEELAVQLMHETGVPASIILSQAVLAGEYGNSPIAEKANNHFRKKCLSDWLGIRLYVEKQVHQECYRFYETVEDSYLDHAYSLMQSRWYSSLFKLDIKDYRAWATGLHQAGYDVTDPDYDKKLIDIIERYQLFTLDAYTPYESFVINKIPGEEEGAIIAAVPTRKAPVNKSNVSKDENVDNGIDAFQDNFDNKDDSDIISDINVIDRLLQDQTLEASARIYEDPANRIPMKNRPKQPSVQTRVYPVNKYNLNKYHPTSFILDLPDNDEEANAATIEVVVNNQNRALMSEYALAKLNFLTNVRTIPADEVKLNESLVAVKEACFRVPLQETGKKRNKRAKKKASQYHNTPIASSVISIP